MMSDIVEIIELFSYSEEEQKTFPYVREYMRRIRPELSRIMADPKARERFMLAGLFLTYRAFNHAGESMSTDTSEMSHDGVHAKRLEAFRRITGREIRSTGEYLKMIRFGVIKLIVFRPAGMLYRFVVHG